MIEELTSDEVRSAHRLMSELGYDLSEPQFRDNVEHLREQGAVIYVAKLDTRIIGLVAARCSVGLVEGAYGEIIALVVASGHRKKGIGRALVKKAEEWVFSRTKTIRVRSNVTRKEAHEFYPSIHFKEAKTQKLYLKIRE